MTDAPTERIAGADWWAKQDLNLRPPYEPAVDSCFNSTGPQKSAGIDS